MVIVDTNVIIDHLRQKQSESQLIKLAKQFSKNVLALSVVSIQELYEGKSTKNPEKEQYLLATIAPLKILPYNYEVAETAGKIARDLRRPIELADAAIAATAIIYDYQLFTLDKKDFQTISGLHLL